MTTFNERAARADAERQALEDRLFNSWWPTIEEFLAEVYRLAAEAIGDESVILAAGWKRSKRAREKFAWTSVRDRWYSAIRELAENSELSAEEIETMFLEADLPLAAFNNAQKILAASVAGGWTVYKTKVELSAELIPKRRPGEEISRYAARVRANARWAATDNAGRASMRDMARRGVKYKTWVSMEDDKVRPSHARVSFTRVPVDEPFIVGGWPMLHPGDMSAPMSETANCRCVLVEGSPSE